MNILLTGASGLIGAALAEHLCAGGHRVIPLERRAAHPGAPTWNPATGTIDLAPAGPIDAVVHLAGETVAQRWTPEAKQRIRDSRVRGTRFLSETLARLPAPPRTLLSASASGFYGDRGNEILTEQSPPGTGFLAEVCQEWEAAAAPAVAAGIRVVHPRFGVVLTPSGGALARMLPLFRLGMGGRLGSGDQHWSWITLPDAVQALVFLLAHPTLSGPVNLVAPAPVTNHEFTRALAKSLHRPAFLPAPSWALKTFLGEMADGALLSSSRVVPAALQASRFQFQHPTIVPALAAILPPDRSH